MRTITFALPLASLALVPLAAAQGKGGLRMAFTKLDGPGPLTLEWSDATYGQGPWETRPTADVDTTFLRLRLRGTEEHAGTWCRLRGRVSIAEPFFVAHPEPMYEGLRKTAPVALKSLGFDLAGEMPKSIYPAEEVFAFMTLVWPYPAFHSDAVLSSCEPILNPGPGPAESFRVWDGAYGTWSESTLHWWQPILSSGSDTTILNMRALTEALIWQQTNGQVGSEFFTSGLAVAAAQVGMVLELQAETVVGSATSPAEFPGEEGELRDPPPGLSGYPAPGMSSMVSYQFTGTGGSHICPFDLLTSMPLLLVEAGESVDFRMNGLFNDTYARLRFNQNPTQEIWIPLNAGDGIATARFRVPQHLSSGTRLQIVGFMNPFGVTTLPTGAFYSFEVL